MNKAFERQSLERATQDWPNTWQYEPEAHHEGPQVDLLFE
jgi:hypothetical protein